MYVSCYAIGGLRVPVYAPGIYVRLTNYENRRQDIGSPNW